MSKNNSGDGCFVFLLILGAISLVLQAISAVFKVALIAILVILGILITYKIIQAIYHFFNPAAKKAYIERKTKEAAEWKKRQLQEEAEVRRKEIARQQHRDGDQQNEPYTYQIGKHGNESLAIRYGIANNELKVTEYWYYAKGGERTRNPDRDKVYYEPATTIRLQKTQKISNNLYEVLLSDYRNRKARAIIELGTEYVKTFYPLEESWFEKHEDLEKTLKGNGTFNLKELATFHVQKTVGV